MFEVFGFLLRDPVKASIALQPTTVVPEAIGFIYANAPAPNALPLFIFIPSLPRPKSNGLK